MDNKTQRTEFLPNSVTFKIQDSESISFLIGSQDINKLLSIVLNQFPEAKVMRTPESDTFQTNQSFSLKSNTTYQSQEQNHLKISQTAQPVSKYGCRQAEGVTFKCEKSIDIINHTGNFVFSNLEHLQTDFIDRLNSLQREK